jgi:hypothetical protein
LISKYISKNKKVQMKNIVFLIVLANTLIFFGCSKKEDQKTTVMKGVINTIMGDVILKKENESSRAKVGDFVISGVTVKTGSKSIAYIAFGQNIIKLSENSVLYIDKLESNIVANNEQISLNLKNGEIFSKTNRKLNKGDFYRIRTSTTVAAIRGTEFVVFERDGQTKVSCISGKVEVASTAAGDTGDTFEFIEISANEEVRVIPDQPLEVTAISEEDRIYFESVFDDIRVINPITTEKIEEDIEEVEEPVFEQNQPQRFAMAVEPARDRDDEYSRSSNIDLKQDTNNEIKLLGSIDFSVWGGYVFNGTTEYRQDFVTITDGTETGNNTVTDKTNFNHYQFGVKAHFNMPLSSFIDLGIGGFYQYTNLHTSLSTKGRRVAGLDTVLNFAIPQISYMNPYIRMTFSFFDKHGITMDNDAKLFKNKVGLGCGLRFHILPSVKLFGEVMYENPKYSHSFGYPSGANSGTHVVGESYEITMVSANFGVTYIFDPYGVRKGR